MAIEFVKYDPSKPEEMKRYDRIAAIVKEKQVQVANAGTLKPKDVCERVSEALGWRLSHYGHHIKCWKYFQVRPIKGSDNPSKTKTKYCHYDVAHQDYVYTEAWVELLIKELSDSNRFNEIMNS